MGKAARALTSALAESVQFTDSLIITKHVSLLDLKPVTVIEGNHPIPVEDSLTAGRAALRFVLQLTRDDLLICLISGGGSALMVAPIIPLSELQSLTSTLYRVAVAGAENVFEIGHGYAVIQAKLKADLQLRVFGMLAGDGADQLRACEIFDSKLSVSEFWIGCGIDTAATQVSALLLWGAGAEPAVALVTAEAGRKLVAESKTPWPKTVRADCSATRAGHPARYLCARRLAPIYGAVPLKCSGCGGRVRLVGLITEALTVRQILEYVGEPAPAPVIALARAPPLEVNGQQLITPEAVEAIPELEFDQTANLAAEAGHDRLVPTAERLQAFELTQSLDGILVVAA